MSLAGSALRIHLTFVLVLLLKASGTMAAEPAAPPNPCSPFKELVAELSGKYQESPHSIGVSTAGALVMLFTTKDGRTWTLVRIPPGDRMEGCVFAAGRNWGDAPPLPTPGKET